MEVKDIIKVQRISLGYTVDDLGKLVGVNGSTISRWENGEIGNMRRDKIMSLAKALHISPMVIIEAGNEENDKEKSNLVNEILKNTFRRKICELSLQIDDEGLKAIIIIMEKIIKK